MGFNPVDLAFGNMNALQSGNERLKAENAKLREELDAAKHDLSVFSEEIVAAKAENAKLRELVEYMHRCFVRGHDWGPYCAGETVWVEQRMRELGVDE